MAASGAEMFFGFAGYIISVLLFLAPGIMMVFKGVAKYTPYPYAVTAAKCAIWLIYGIRQGITRNQSTAAASTAEMLINSGVAWVNGVGMVVELLYIVLFFVRSPAHDRRRKPLVIAVAGGVLAVLLGGAAFAVNDTLASCYCALCGLAVYAVPLYDVLKVLLSRRARHMPPLPIGFVSLCNGLAWCIFTGFRHDFYMFYPNLAGVVCACVQLGLHIMYWHKTGALADFEAEDDDDPLGEGLMDEGTGEGTLIDNIRLFFSEDPFFV